MSFWQRLLHGGSTQLSVEQRDRVEAWRVLPEPELDRAMPLLRTLVVDVEASGLDLFRDRLIAIGALGVRDSRIMALRPGLPCSSSARASSSRTVGRPGPP